MWQVRGCKLRARDLNTTRGTLVKQEQCEFKQFPILHPFRPPSAKRIPTRNHSMMITPYTMSSLSLSRGLVTRVARLVMRRMQLLVSNSGAGRI